MEKRIYDPAMVRDLLAERERNGWSLGELSRRSGIPVGTLSTWSAKAARSRHDGAPPTDGFAEVVLAPPDSECGNTMARLRHASGWAIDLQGEAAIVVATKLAEAITRCS